MGVACSFVLSVNFCQTTGHNIQDQSSYSHNHENLQSRVQGSWYCSMYMTNLSATHWVQ